MVKNYLKIAVRNLWKQKLFSFVNIFGFAIGLTVSFIVVLYVQFELSYDQVHQNKDQLYRVLRQSDINGELYYIGVTSGPFAQALKNDFPESITDVVRVMPADGLVTYGNNAFMEKQFFLADKNFFQVFSFPLRHGNPANVLELPNSIVLTPETARKYFGDSDPLGKVLTLDNRWDFMVTGVMEHDPTRTHLDFDFVASIEILSQFGWFNDWWNNGLITYAIIPNPEEAMRVESQLTGFMDKYFGEDFKKSGNRIGLTLQPFSDVYFEKDVRYDRVLHGDKNTVMMFAAVALFILIIACINFMNLTTARAGRRAKEIGVRKVLGALRSKLVLQFLSESFLITLIAILLSVASVELLLPWFNSIFSLQLSIDFTSPSILLLLLGLLILVALFAGGYPAFILSSFKPIRVLKGKTGPKAESIVIRKGLVVFQFCVSTFLIVGTLLIGQQLTYLEGKDMGFDDEHVLLVHVNTAEIQNQAETLKARWQAEAGVVSVSAMSGQPGGFHDATSVSIEGKDQESRLRTAFTDFDYVETLGLQIVAGRNFSRDFGTDREQALLLNETAVRQLGWTNDEALGKKLSGAFFDLKESRVVGVVADYHFSSLKEGIEPLLIAIRPFSRLLAIKVKSEDLQGTISAVEQIWKTSLPGYPFEFTFLDETFAALYQQEQRESKLFLIFSVLSIMIASLGVFALQPIQQKSARGKSASARP